MKTDSVYSQKLGKRFREIRLEAGLTQTELGEKLYVTRIQIYNYEKAKRKITKRTAYMMEQLFNIDSNYLLDENVITKKKERKA